MNLFQWIILPLVSALIAWGTNVLAIRFLFRPRRPIKLFGYTLQGMIPKRQQELARKTAEIVERELLQQDFLHNSIRSIDLRPHLQKLIKTLVQQRLAEKLKSIPLLGSFIGPSTLNTLETLALEEMTQQIEPLMQNIATELEHKVQIRHHIEEQISRFNLEQLEEVVYRIASREFRDIELMGGVIGGIIGLFHALVWHLLSYL